LSQGACTRAEAKCGGGRTCPFLSTWGQTYGQIGGGRVDALDVQEAVDLGMDSRKREPYFFLGNTKAHPQTFMIVGLYYPAKASEMPLNRPSPGSLRLPGL
jgi:hypothetical protein